MKSVTQVYLRRIRPKNTNNCKNKQTVTCILLAVVKGYTITYN